jgi:dihydroxy-acid dehydratase
VGGLYDKVTRYGDPGFSRFLRRAMSRNLGFSADDFERPVVGVLNTFSEVNRCHAHFGPLVEAIKRGVLMAGGVPLEFPTISLGEPFLEPSAMLFRNLAAMDAEEMIRAQPFDAVVLVGGCDKTLPALVMGAASADLPALVVSGGPMLAGDFQGERLGACTDCRRYWTEWRAGRIDADTLEAVNRELAPTHGHCMVMGTASTMAITIEALGLMLPGGAAIPAVHQERLAHAEASGKAAVALARASLRPSRILTPRAYRNALTVLAAIGGSTNAVVHLTAMAARSGIRIALDDFDRISRRTPLLTQVKPVGRYHLEDFYHAGGVPALMWRLRALLEPDALTVTGRTHRENWEALRVADRPVPEAYREVLADPERPFKPDGGLRVLRGNLCPDGAVIKSHAATPGLLRHRGPALVFENEADLERRLSDVAATPEHVLVLKSIGPVGGPGMPEAGMIPIPPAVLRRGVRDMVRISDGRMSGTAYGTVVLHVAPEAAVGGPLAAVETGDMVRLDVEAGVLEVEVAPEDLARRLAARRRPPRPARGYRRLYFDHVLQAPEGVDFDFLRPPTPWSLWDDPPEAELDEAARQRAADGY